MLASYNMSQIQDMSVQEENPQTEQSFPQNHSNHGNIPQSNEEKCCQEGITEEEGDALACCEMEFLDEECKDLAQIPSDIADSTTEKEEKPQGDKRSQAAFDQYMADIQKQPDAESKLRHSIDFMESSLSQGGNPNFRNFWEARKQSLVLFKENISPSSRAQHWSKYVELSNEARRLKDILDEQSAFAAEQIDIAVKALEDDINRLDQLIESSPVIEFPIAAISLKAKQPLYNQIQRELNILNVHASRINALRKELIKTEMRVRHKNKFFQRLSLVGDKVFPRRKDLIKEISTQFMTDIDTFITVHFSSEEAPYSLFAFREEIKALQGIAKILTLNTQSFTATRTRLSECWDKIKRLEKERKKERAKQKNVFKQNFDDVMEKIREFNQVFQTGSLNIQAGNQQIDQIVSMMRGVELGRDELGALRSELNNSRKLIQDKIKAEEQVRQHHEQEKDRAKKERIIGLRVRIETLLANIDARDIDSIMAERDAILEEIQIAPASKIEKQDLERQLKPLKDAITEKKERALLNLSADDQQSLLQLREVLKQRKERRQEIKNQLEVYRKASATSGFDFEKAMSYNAQINEEKERLEKINISIEEIEDKIKELQSKA